MFRANSLYDPDYTGAGHQPLGFDQWSAVYGYYYVRRARIKVSEMAVSQTTYNPGMLSVGVRRKNTGFPSTIEEAAEDPNYSKLIKVAGGGTSIAAGPVRYVEQEVDIAKFIGVKDIADEEDLGALVTANCSETVYFDVNTVNVGGVTPGDLHLLVEIEYDCVFKEPKTLIQS